MAKTRQKATVETTHKADNGNFLKNSHGEFRRFAGSSGVFCSSIPLL
jgi:hypothetical protein